MGVLGLVVRRHGQFLFWCRSGLKTKGGCRLSCLRFFPVNLLQLVTFERCGVVIHLPTHTPFTTP